MRHPSHTRAPSFGLMLLGLIGCFVAAGCSSGPKVLPTQSHAPGSPDQVKLYPKPPAEYELLGLVSLDLTPQYRLDDNAHADAAFTEMIRRAAAMGGNGLLFEVPPGQSNASVTAGYHGTFYQVPVNSQGQRTALAQAIYVVKP